MSPRSEKRLEESVSQDEELLSEKNERDDDDGENIITADPPAQSLKEKLWNTAPSLVYGLINTVMAIPWYVFVFFCALSEPFCDLLHVIVLSVFTVTRQLSFRTRHTNMTCRLSPNCAAFLQLCISVAFCSSLRCPSPLARSKTQASSS